MPSKTIASDPEGLRTMRVNGSRMMETLHSTCVMGKAHPWGSHPTETGMARLALNDDDKQVRLWLISQAEALGCKVTIDQMGNIFAVRPGRNNSVAPIMMGSHLDTQPTGGRYDGILGVMAGLEVLRTLHDKAYETSGPIGLVNWTNEEGARFPLVTVSSAVWASVLPLSTAWDSQDVSSPTTTLKSELERTGFLGTQPCSYLSDGFPMAAHFEVHIEQGPILEDSSLKVGVVTGGQAYNWYEIEVLGRDTHAGTTPLGKRSDALLAASRMVVAARDEVAVDAKGLATTGIMQVEPGSVNTVARRTKFTLDVRHPDDEALAGMVGKLRDVLGRIAREEKVEVGWKTLTENTAVKFDLGCVEAVEEAAKELCGGGEEGDMRDKKGGWTYLTSGAGHDSCNTSRRCPTAMIFAVTRGGASHCPDEYCSPEDCVTSADVLLGAVLRYDMGRAKREGWE